MKISKIIISAVCIVLSLLCLLGKIGVFPYVALVPDMFKVGIDYISLDYDKNSPKKSEILKEAQNVSAGISHPFILVDNEAFDVIRQEVENDSFSTYTKGLYDYVMANANALLDVNIYPPMEYALDEEDSILPISREVINRIIILGFAWQISGDAKYAERAWTELEKVCSYDDWCTSHFLATAEMALAVSVGYDWFFDYLDDEQKSILAETTWKYAIEPALSKNYLKNWFTWSKNNWNSICYSGIGISAMAFFDYSPEEAADFLYMCYKNMPIAFENFTPDGVYAEGPGYSQSGMNSIVYFISTSNNYFGTDFGMSEIDGVKQLGSFSAYVTSPVGVFNFGDNKNRLCYSPVLHWYATEFMEPLAALHQLGDEAGQFSADLSESVERNGEGKENALSLLWYDRDITSENTDFSSEKTSVYLTSDAGQDMVIMRSSYTDENSSFAAIKGGYNFINHGDLDIGTFVYDAMGVRWAEELGPGNYDADSYFMNLPFGGRWKNYCKRAEGQNTLVINPDITVEDQYVLAEAEFAFFEAEENSSKCILDMTDAYIMNMAKSVTREFELDYKTGGLRIADRIECLYSSEIYWFMHTKADIKISEDKKSAMLTIDGKKMQVTLKGDGEFSVLSAVALKGKYQFDDEYSDINKLTVHIEQVKNAEIIINFIPLG